VDSVMGLSIVIRLRGPVSYTRCNALRHMRFRSRRRQNRRAMSPCCAFALRISVLVSILVAPGSPSVFAQDVSRSDDPNGRISQYTESVKLSTGEVRRGDICVTFEPRMESGTFFDGLERIDLDSGVQFRKDSSSVFNFPSYLKIDIHVSVHVCDSNLYTPARSPDFMKGMKFRAQWKRNLDLRPVANITLENVPLSLEEGDNRLLFVLRIRDEDVPLTDHLIISVLTAQGKLLSRMSARL